MVNIINNKEIIPELIQKDCNPDEIFKSVYYLIPSLIRPFILFVYKYFILLGFLDFTISFGILQGLTVFIRILGFWDFIRILKFWNFI